MSLMTVMRRRTTQKDGVIYRPLKTCIEASRFAIYPRFSLLERMRRDALPITFGEATPKSLVVGPLVETEGRPRSRNADLRR
jgi:hypothetical protein